jgi:hypothetical protein
VEAALINPDGQTDRHRNMTKVTGTSRHYANSPNKEWRRIGSCILRNIKGSILPSVSYNFLLSLKS